LEIPFCFSLRLASAWALALLERLGSFKNVVPQTVGARSFSALEIPFCFSLRLASAWALAAFCVARQPKTV